MNYTLGFVLSLAAACILTLGLELSPERAVAQQLPREPAQTRPDAATRRAAAEQAARSDAARSFDLLLRGMGARGTTTGADLEAAAQRIHAGSVGGNIEGAREALREAIRAGINPARAERIVRTGQMLDPVLGYRSTHRLIWAIGRVDDSTEPLSQLVRQMGLVTEREIVEAREAAKYGRQIPYMDRWVLLIERHAASLYGIKHTAVVPAAPPEKKFDPNAFRRLLQDLETAWPDNRLTRPR